MRIANITRKTNETDILVGLDLDGGGCRVETGIGFFDHMLEQLSRHGGMGLEVKCSGDLNVDGHHTVESCARRGAQDCARRQARHRALRLGRHTHG